MRPSKTADVGGAEVRRALPQAGRRTVGAWCFLDHFGPVEAEAAMQIGPHPHTGLHTVTWLVEGGLVHKDSLGTEQPIRPGQLNLMSAGHGIAHAEESPWRNPSHGEKHRSHGAQLWVAQPDATRNGPPAFEHHGELPQAEVGDATATVLIGRLAGLHSPARADTPLVGAELVLRPGQAEVELDTTFEHALVVLSGRVTVDGEPLGVGTLGFLAEGRADVTLSASDDARLLLIGGQPFEADPYMSWNFVGRSRDEVREAAAAWNEGDDSRFGPVASALPRIPAPTSSR